MATPSLPLPFSPVWETRLPDPTPPREEVHIWRMDMGDFSSAPGVSPLSEEEKSRARRWLREEDRRRFHLGRSGLRKLLGHYLGRDPASLRFRYSEQGRPELAEAPSPLQFNLAHSGEIILFGVTASGQVGVDVEKVEASRDSEAIASRYFAPAERDLLSRLSRDQRVEAFFQIWTLKEAYLKATGLGLSGGLNRFSLVPGPDSLPYPPGWKFFSVIPQPQYWGAIAFVPEVLIPRYFSFKSLEPFS